MIREIKQYFKSKQETMPEVTGFVFGTEEQALREAVSKFDGYYMFVDRGVFDSDRDNNNNLKDSLVCGVTIARPVGAQIVSFEEIAEIDIESFELISRLRAEMLDDQRCIPWLKCLSDNHSIMPFVAPDICRSIGNTLSFVIEGYDLLEAKGNKS